MKRILSLFSNTVLATSLAALILIPVAFVGLLGGTIRPQQGTGATLGAQLNRASGRLSEKRSGEIKEISFTTFWGSEANYKNIMSVKNEGNTSKSYRLEILKVKGPGSEEQEVSAYFADTSVKTVVLAPGETAWVNLKVIASPSNDVQAARTHSSILLAIWEKPAN